MASAGQASRSGCDPCVQFPSAAPLSHFAMFLTPNAGRKWVGEFEALRFLQAPRRLVLGLRPGLRAVAAACESCRTFSTALLTVNSPAFLNFHKRHLRFFLPSR